MRDSMAWRSTYREQAIREARRNVMLNVLELAALAGLVAGLLRWMA